MAKFKKAHNCNACPYKSKYLDFLPKEDVDLIQSSCLIVRFKKGEAISKQGTDATHVLYLANGCVKLYVEGRNKNIIIKIMNTSSYIGLHSIFSDRKHLFNVEAVEDSQICMIETATFLELAKSNPDFLFEITKFVSGSVNSVCDKIIDINQKQLKGRLADVLIHLAEDLYGSNVFNLPFTRKELAEMGAMSTENAVRMISELKKEGIVKEKGKQFEIVHMDILKKISEIG